MSQPLLSQDTLKRLLHYSEDTGIFRWLRRSDVRECWNTRYAGKEAGYPWSPNAAGRITYRVIRIFDWPFLAHRLAVLYVTGAWPENLVDHRDLDGENNRWPNLRSATDAQNGANRGPNANNTTGFKGVSVARSGRFRATIQFSGTWKQIGIFDTAEEAAAAYEQEARLLAGEFARSSW